MNQTSVGYYKQIIRMHGLFTILNVKSYFEKVEENPDECRLIELAIIATNPNYPLELTDQLIEETRINCIREGHGESYISDKMDRSYEIIAEVTGKDEAEFRAKIETMIEEQELFDSLISTTVENTGVSESQATKRVNALFESGIFEDKSLSESARKKKFVQILETHVD